MNFEGLLVGVFTFLIIGVSHPIVIKTEYYFGTTSVVDLSPHGTCRFGRGSFCRGHDNKFASRGTFLHRILGYQRTLRTGTAGGARMVSAKPQTPL